MRKLNKNNGITLISLVITIIIMLILVGVSITLAVNGGLFEYAGNAVGDTKNAINQEQGLIDEIINDYIKLNTMKSYEETEKDEATGVLKANAKYIDEEHQVAIIPKGFAIIPGLNGSTKISDGLVITDGKEGIDEEGNLKGNEFVWIPIEVVKEGENADSETSIAKFYRSNWSNNGRGKSLMDNTSYTEPYVSGYSDGKGTEETKEYDDMLKSVYTYEGFYIGRYEAGTDTARTDTANGTSKMVVQRDKYPYTYVGWGASMTDYTGELNKQGLGALALSKAMYANKDVGVTSTLCYGVMWDAMLDFIKDDSHEVTNSTTWGNYCNNTGETWKITRVTAIFSEDFGDTWTPVGESEKTKESEACIFLTTGASDDFSSKNIYDVAGNVLEWTNEAGSDTMRVVRGGYYHSGYGVKGTAAYRRNYTANSVHWAIGFRPALYIK